ncbi:FkbM family methyltransferase [Pelagovum pacificum]|uniref:FkbM family methyltransferase n=1 Tax=Pelagovum pacificum TaxID=2588711 RepID=A0A5C5GH05_9RHOB|nr:FkbM family methyltransferase [Pelagovum pacificum]QQA42804.1 FkbM family methyltransferase [Pelagovum pacificum]TNY34048.1 FkbM family methyltransferase [Pelagovum pacificum]
MWTRLKNAAARRLPNDGTINCQGIVLEDDEKIVVPRVRKNLLNGNYEMQERMFLDKLIEPGEQILEIGAGLGFISTFCAKHRYTKSIVTVEANPALIPYIAKTHSLNAVKVEVINALFREGDEGGTATFYIREPFWGSSLRGGGSLVRDEVEVPTMSFNAFVAERQPTMIICDIEGGEVELLKAAEMPSVNKFMVEVHTGATGPAGVNTVFSEMMKRGFYYSQKFSTGPVVCFLRDT